MKGNIRKTMWAVRRRKVGSPDADSLKKGMSVKTEGKMGGIGMA
jgi:hypothetical protein